jgi:oligopeptide transport system ATP-binding protein
MSATNTLLEVHALKRYFPIRRGPFGRDVQHVHAVDGVSFSLKRGETLGLVGESGCGKSTLARLLLRLDTPDEGAIRFEGEDIAGYDPARLRPFRREIQAVFQDPYSSLNPRKTVWQIVSEPLRVHKMGTRAEIRAKVEALVAQVGLRPEHLDRYPHEFSGGQRQRIGIARALALRPKLIVCDEAVSALDVSIRSQILNLLVELREELGLTYVFISHDLTVVEHISDVVAVMYLGKIVETAPAEEFYARPHHPYSEALLSATPLPDPDTPRQRIVLQGDVPSPVTPPSGCRFRTRCPLAQDRCAREEPLLRPVGPERLVACHFRG